MIALRMARLAPSYSIVRPDPARAGETGLAFRYLFMFRRIVVSLALLGAVGAWIEQWPGLLAAFICVGIGELLESSYYLNVLRWRAGARHDDPAEGAEKGGVSPATIRSA
jgi:hypothetical protein